MLKQFVTILVVVTCLAGCGKSPEQLSNHELKAVVYVDTKRGDPFGGKTETTSELIGELGPAKMITYAFKHLDNTTTNLRSPIPAMGVVARLDFMGDAGKVAGTARLYLPHGLLVLGSDDTKSGRFPELSSAVVSLLKEKKPDHIAEIDEALRSHGYSLLNLTSPVQSDNVSKPAKP